MDGSPFNRHMSLCTSILPVFDKVIPNVDYTPHHLTIMPPFTIELLFNPVMYFRQYLDHIIPTSLFLYLIEGRCRKMHSASIVYSSPIFLTNQSAVSSLFASKVIANLLHT